MRKPTPLKRAIFERQLVQRDLAAELGIDPGYLSQIVGGRRCGDVLARRIAEKVGAPLDSLFTADGDHWVSVPPLAGHAASGQAISGEAAA